MLSVCTTDPFLDAPIARIVYYAIVSLTVLIIIWRTHDRNLSPPFQLPIYHDIEYLSSFPSLASDNLVGEFVILAECAFVEA